MGSPTVVTVLPPLITAFATIISAIIVARTTIYVARLKQPYEKEDHGGQDQVAKGPSKLTTLLRVSPGFVGPLIFGLAIVAVFVYIHFVSDYAFWFVVLAYIIMAAGYRPSSK
jgi:hypothetical protein